MTTWKGVRKELVGAWRSVQYDLTRVRRRAGDGDETTELIFPEHSARPPRRVVATSGFALVSVAGAVGTYFAVVNGLGTLLDEPDGPEEPARVMAGADGTGRRPPEASPDKPVRIARQGGPLTAAGRQATPGGAESWDTHDGAPTDVGPAPDPVPNPGTPVPEESDAPLPEDPTGPTSPPPSASPSPTPVQPTPTGSPTPSPSVRPTADDEDYEGRHRHRHHGRHRDEAPE